MLTLLLRVFEANALRPDRRNFRYGTAAVIDDNTTGGAAGTNTRSLLMDFASEVFFLCVML